jgi:hypothetical protein
MKLERGLASLCAVLLAGNGVLTILLLRERPSHETLPLFVPVSLEYEKAMRTARSQPAGRGGEEATAVAEVLATMDLDPATKAAITPHVEALGLARQRVLALRNERHQLNVALMEVGTELGATLTERQWDIVERGRDAVRAEEDAAVFERLRQKLANP